MRLQPNAILSDSNEFIHSNERSKDQIEMTATWSGQNSIHNDQLKRSICSYNEAILMRSLKAKRSEIQCPKMMKQMNFEWHFQSSKNGIL